MLEWKPQERIPGGIPARDRWIDALEEGLWNLGAEDWINAVRDRDL